MEMAEAEPQPGANSSKRLSYADEHEAYAAARVSQFVYQVLVLLH